MILGPFSGLVLLLILFAMVYILVVVFEFWFISIPLFILWLVWATKRHQKRKLDYERYTTPEQKARDKAAWDRKMAPVLRSNAIWEAARAREKAERKRL